jgi:hypothetical protein
MVEGLFLGVDVGRYPGMYEGKCLGMNEGWYLVMDVG